MTQKPPNLDRLAAQRAQEFIRKTIDDDRKPDPKSVDNTVTNALGVLRENGIYACALFLKSRPKTEKQRADALLSEMLHLLAGLGFGWGRPDSEDAYHVLAYPTEKVTSGKLERLLLAKETLEQMLIYARYGAKARVAEKGD